MPNNLSTLSALEQFVALGAATVTVGGNTAPAAGTVETWTFSGSSLPPASNTFVNAMPPNGFYIQDPAQPTEVMAVTNVSGATATVIRGADGTVPVAHGSSPFTVEQVASGNTLAALWPMWQPAHNGILDAVFPPDIASGAALVTAGVLNLSKIVPRYSYLASKVVVYQATAGAGASTGTFVGLYSQTGTLLTGSADCGAALIGGSTAVSAISLNTPQNITAGVPYYVAFLCNYATTQSQMRQAASGSTATPNFGLTAAQARGATFGTGQTALPASIAMGSVALGPVNLFGIS